MVWGHVLNSAQKSHEAITHNHPLFKGGGKKAHDFLGEEGR